MAAVEPLPLVPAIRDGRELELGVAEFGRERAHVGQVELAWGRAGRGGQLGRKRVEMVDSFGVSHGSDSKGWSPFCRWKHHDPNAWAVGGTMIADVFTLVAFWAMILAPSLVAMHATKDEPLSRRR